MADHGASTSEWLLCPPPGTEMLDSGAARWWIEDGVLFNQSYLDGTVTKEHLLAGFAVARQLTGGRPAPLVAEAGPLQSTTREARDLLASAEAAALFPAMGVLVRSPVAHTIVNFFIRFSSPPYEVRIFNDPQLARAWARARRPA